jgi:hypothetical protein
VGSVNSIPVAGGSPVALGGTFLIPLGAIAVDATSIYFTAGEDYSSAVFSLPLAGGAVTTLASGQSAHSVAIDSANVYWTNWAPAPPGNIRSVPRTGGYVTMRADNQGVPSSIAADGTNVYWTDSSAGTVMRVAASGGALTTLATGLTHPSGIAVDATSVYFGTHDAVMKLTPK